MTLDFDIAARTHRGLVRQLNQDTMLVLTESDGLERASVVAAVADGMGGLPAGDVASRLAIGALRTSLLKAPGSESPGARLENAIVEANQTVHDDAMTNSAHFGMGTTLTAALISKDRLFISHVGDSRAYLMRGQELSLLTVDHTWVQEGIEAGMLTPEQAESHPYRNMLTRAIGLDPHAKIFEAEQPLRPRDVILVCSDGLHGEVEKTEIARALENGTAHESAESLETLALASGGRDNVTVAVIKVTG